MYVCLWGGAIWAKDLSIKQLCVIYRLGLLHGSFDDIIVKNLVTCFVAYAAYLYFIVVICNRRRERNKILRRDSYR